MSLEVLEFKKYKPSLLFIGFVNLFFKYINSKIVYQDQVWTEVFASYIRKNDTVLLEDCKKILKEFEEELMICEDWLEMFDVLGNFLGVFKINHLFF